MKTRFFFILTISSVMVLSSCGRNVNFYSGTINKILRRLTVEEKAQLVTGVSAFTTLDSLGVHPEGIAGATTPIKRMYVPSISFADGPAGLNLASEHTCYPCGTMLASTWDKDLVGNVASRIAEEARKAGVDVVLGPSINIQRNPLGGRNFEYFSEDPILTGRLATSYVKGLQSKGVGACIKHFALNNQESGREFNNAHVSPRALREIYLRGFEMTVKKSHPWVVMSSSNKINGVYASNSKNLLTNLLRTEWGFDGVVVSSWNHESNVVDMLKAGNDLIEPGNKNSYNNIIEAVDSGLLSEDELNINTKRVLNLLNRCTLDLVNMSSHHSAAENAALARKCAADGMVLLENNDNFLPFTAEDHPSVAIYGRDTLIAGGIGSSAVLASHIAPLSEGLVNAGFRIADNPDEADVAFVVISRGAEEGKDRPLSDFYLSKEEKNLLNNVCKNFHKRNKKVLVILNTGGVIETASWKNLPDALLLTWLPGQEGGNAVADIVTGAVNPSGHLTQTFPIDCMDAASSSNFPIIQSKPANGKSANNFNHTNYQEGLYVGYRYFDTFNKEVSYPFGYGLSYTTFSMDDPEVIELKIRDMIEITVEVTNTGERAGRAVAQVYVKAPVRGMQEKPSKELKAFGKTDILKPGESEVLSFIVSKTYFSSYNEASCSWNLDSGIYIFMAGNSSVDITGETAKYIKNSLVIPVEDVLALDRPLNELRVRKSIFKEHIRKVKSSQKQTSPTETKETPIAEQAQTTKPTMVIPELPEPS
ncbi:MAG: glycoside hydrolase family 3 C-terminal domain-containing protein, partial [Bacteroidales bacterium]|nr:glycoside hydrolase family 3 C-terminal domain-containing protein [Bacteroidales bacterium]